MLLVFDRIIKKDAIQAYEKTWHKFTEFNNHDFQQILQRQIEESSKNETKIQSWQEDEKEHTQKIESVKEKFFEKQFY